MNSQDAYHWKSGREKVEAGLPLTDTERDVLLYFGVEAMPRPTPVVRAPLQGRATKQRAQMHTTSFAGKLRFCDLPRGSVRRTP